MPLQQEKPTFVQQTMPWIGAVLLAMGSLQTVLLLRGGGRAGMQGMIAALGLSAAGAGLIQRRTTSLPARFAFLGAAVALGALAAMAIPHR